MSASDKPLQSNCHCGAIKVTLSRLPEYVNECQCTICRRYAAAWGYYYSNELKIEQTGAGTKTYVWGDCDNEFHFCNHCGCVVYWWQIKAGENGTHKVGVNTRNMRPSDVALVERRIMFDAVGFPLNNKALRHPDDAAEYPEDKPSA